MMRVEPIAMTDKDREFLELRRKLDELMSTPIVDLAQHVTLAHEDRPCDLCQPLIDRARGFIDEVRVRG